LVVIFFYVSKNSLQGLWHPKKSSFFATFLPFLRHYNMRLNDFMENILPLKDKLYRFALCIVRNREEAEDIVQEAMIKVWNGNYDTAVLLNPAAYCFTITKHLALDRLRRKDFTHDSLQKEGEHLAEPATPYSRLNENEQWRIVEHLIARLPEEKRMLIQLRDIEGESYKQIAQLLDLSESQVKTNLFRARQELKQLFKKIDGYERL
jgi:RNA polymerase sigma-70 factor (ECF subfamily)